jgi:hypothetical protein
LNGSKHFVQADLQDYSKEKSRVPLAGKSEAFPRKSLKNSEREFKLGDGQLLKLLGNGY